jgi:hypothetical protein
MSSQALSQRWPRFLFLRCCLAFVATGCALAGPQGGDRSKVSPAPRRVPVHVTNDNVLDVDIYAVGHDEAMWLGQAASMRATTFALPAWFVRHGPVRLLIDPVGGVGHYYSDPVFVGADQELDLTVAPADLAVSSLAVFPARSRAAGGR